MGGGKVVLIYHYHDLLTVKSINMQGGLRFEKERVTYYRYCYSRCHSGGGGLFCLLPAGRRGGNSSPGNSDADYQGYRSPTYRHSAWRYSYLSRSGQGDGY